MPGRRFFFVYLLANSTPRVLYVGMTQDLKRRVAAHRAGVGAAFTRRFNVRKLVWFEVHESPVSAILREKQLKGGSRSRKLALIRASNPEWRDLWEDIQG